MNKESFKFGWAQADITPTDPVVIAGQFHARVSEGVMDPLTVTALAIESSADQTVMVSCDIVSIPDALRDAVREKLAAVDGLDSSKVWLNATHTHSAPQVSTSRYNSPNLNWGVDLPVLPADKYAEFVSDRIATTVTKAWTSRDVGSFAFGLGQAVVGRNRRWTNFDGVSKMYGNITSPEFNHIEGYEDQNIGVAAFYSTSGDIVGVIVNIACPSQVDEHAYEITADYWCNVREGLRRRYGKDLFVLPQCSAAGELAPQRMGTRKYTYDSKAEARMLRLKSQTERQQIGERVTNTVTDVLDCIKPTRDSNPPFRHVVVDLPLPVYRLTAEQAAEADRDAAHFKAEYEAEKDRLESTPGAKDEPRWYVNVTRAFRLWARHARTRDRFDQQDKQPVLNFDIHVLRIGDMAMASNPFEYYLDYGIQIKARSAATQTFLVQLAGPGSYLPSLRSLAGGGYGSVPASNNFGPEAGAILREATIRTIDSLFKNDNTPSR